MKATHPTRALALMIVGTAVLQIRNELRIPIVPFAEFLMLGVQVVPAILVLGTKPTSWSREARWCLAIIVLLLVVALSSAFTAGAYAFDVLQRTLLTFAGLLFVFLVVMTQRSQQRAFWVVAKAFVVLGVVLALIGVVLFVAGKEVSGAEGRVQVLEGFGFRLAQWAPGIPPFVRVSSLAGNPNTLASLLFFSIPLTLALRMGRRLSLVWTLVCLSVQGLGLVLTFSRIGLGATTGAAVTVYLFAGKRLAHRAVSVTLLAAGMAVIAGMMLVPHVGDLESSGRVSLGVTDRDLAWTVLWAQVSESPLFGVGFGVSMEALLLPQGLSISGHNVHLSLLAEIGVPGYLLVCVLWIGAGVRLLIKTRHSLLGGDERVVLASAASALVFLFIHQAFESQVLRFGVHTLMWAYFVALAFSPRQTWEIEHPSPA